FALVDADARGVDLIGLGTEADPAGGEYGHDQERCGGEAPGTSGDHGPESRGSAGGVSPGWWTCSSGLRSPTCCRPPAGGDCRPPTGPPLGNHWATTGPLLGDYW